jgi:hypothetical protein
MVYVIQTTPEMNCNSLKHDWLIQLMRTIYVLYCDIKFYVNHPDMLNNTYTKIVSV